MSDPFCSLYHEIHYIKYGTLYSVAHKLGCVIKQQALSTPHPKYNEL